MKANSMEQLRGELAFRRGMGATVANVRLDELDALLGVVEAAWAFLAHNEADDTDALCFALGRLDGRDDHDWSAWSEPFEAMLGDRWRDRLCRACGAYQKKRVPPPADAPPESVPSPADDLLERVLLAQLPEDEEGAG